MPFDPTLPADGSLIVAAELRSQFQALHDAIASIPAGPEGPQGPPGEVTQAQLSNDLANNANATFNTIIPLTSNNSNLVAELNYTPSDPPTAADFDQLLGKLNELIVALRR